MWHLDNTITNYILDHTNIFENIHPNYVTIFGFGLNLLIYNELFNKADDKKDWNKLALIFGLRWFADCLDGNMARRYKKESKLGNILDTTSDLVFQGIIAYYFYKNTKNPILKSIFFYGYILIVLMLIFKFDIFNTHDNLKQEKGDLLSYLICTITRNSIIYFIAIYYLVKNAKTILPN